MAKESKTSQRRDAMVDYISAQPITTPNQLVEHFEVSGETVRKDLEFLVREGLVHKVHGGVVAADHQNSERSYDTRGVEHMEEKKRIARAACAMIEPGDAILLENGTTVMQLAHYLKEQPELLKSTLILTQSFRIADVLKDCEGARLFFLGGWLRHGDMMAYGNYTQQILSNFNINKSFIGSAGLNDSLVLTDFFDEEVSLRQQIIKQSKSTILLLDSSKFYKTKVINVCHLTEMSHLITDTGCSPMMRSAIQDSGVKLTIV